MIRYRMVGSQDPEHRIDRVVDGAKELELNGDPVALSDAQYERISRFARLEPVISEEEREQASEEALKPASGRSPVTAKDKEA